MPLTEGSVCAQRFALCHLCWCWVNKQKMKQRTAEEACGADHTQKELKGYFKQEERACAAALKMRKAAFFQRVKQEKKKAGKLVSLRKKPAALGGVSHVRMQVRQHKSGASGMKKRPAGATNK